MVASITLGRERRFNLILIVVGELEELIALNLLTGVIRWVLGLTDDSLPVLIVQIGTDRGDPHIDGVGIATLVLLFVLNVEADIISLDNDGRPFTGLLEKIVVGLSFGDPLVADILVDHGVFEVTDDIENSGEGR